MDTRKRRKEATILQSTLFESLQSPPKRARVHAQRKFAFGQGSHPNSPALTPIKDGGRELRERTRLSSIVPSLSNPISVSTSSVAVRPKTEDFLTFLCFRGSPILPPELEFFETPQTLEGSNTSRGTSPLRDEKMVKLKREGLDKRQTSKDDVRKSLESIYIEPPSPPTSPPCLSPRVTRSSASLTPRPSFLVSPNSSELSSPTRETQRNLIKRRIAKLRNCKTNSLDLRDTKLTKKQFILRKAMILKSKALRAQQKNLQRVLPDGEKYHVRNLTRARAAKVSKRRALRVQERLGLPRILKRIGAIPEKLSSSSKGLLRVTRSRADTIETKPIKEEVISESEPDSNDEGPEDAMHITPVLSESIKAINGEDTRVISAMKAVEKELVKVSVVDIKKEPPDEKNAEKLKEMREMENKELIRKKKEILAHRRVTRGVVSKGVTVNESPQLRTMRSSSDTQAVCGSSSKCELAKNSSLNKLRSKSCEDRNQPEKNPSLQLLKKEKESIRSRPIRKTKQVAEVYMEVISQKLAKESQNNIDEDEDDTISISSIKALTAFNKNKTKHVDIEKCVLEITEKHEKAKDYLNLSTPTKVRSSRGQLTSLSHENSSNMVMKRELRSSSEHLPEQNESILMKDSVAKVSQRRDLRSTSESALESENSSTELKENICETSDENKKERLENTNELGLNDRSRSLKSTKLTNSCSPKETSLIKYKSLKSPKVASPTRSSPRSSNSSLVPQSISDKFPKKRALFRKRAASDTLDKCVRPRNKPTRRYSHEVKKSEMKGVESKMSALSLRKKNILTIQNESRENLQ